MLYLLALFTPFIKRKLWLKVLLHRICEHCFHSIVLHILLILEQSWLHGIKHKMSYLKTGCGLPFLHIRVCVPPARACACTSE
jgi:hypothetical protein